MKTVLIVFCEPNEYDAVCEHGVFGQVVVEPSDIFVECNSPLLVAHEDAYLLVHNIVDDSVVLERV